ncbi:MAG: aminopeptidase P family protein [Anaeroplasmataceae bacterium]|nr:aminopeptidase P family protein [Anaeroplasmataceae bacterium]
MDKIRNFQKILGRKQIKAYIIPTSDYHNSEYVSSYFKGRAFLTGFTGSAGTLIITQDKAYLWTDGRYHIQAAKQIENRPIVLMKQGNPGVPTITEFLSNYLIEGDTLAFDGKVLSANMVLELIKNLPNIKIKADEDILQEVWSDRPNLPFSFIYKLETFFTGKSFQEKINLIREEMKQKNATVHILTSLEDQAWLYNLRANDIEHTPVFLAYTIITYEDCYLFLDQRKLDKMLESYLKENKIILNTYFYFYEFIKNLNNQNILVDYNIINYSTYLNIISENTLMNFSNPSLLMKAIKNETEIKNIISAHIKDGVAFTKFMYYLKNNIQTSSSMSEISVSEYLQKQRENQEGFVDVSFNTICAYKEHAAMMHYSATPATNATLKPEDLLLIDSGGHYLDGTTDITRTLALGSLTSTQKLHFTTVLKSVIALSEAVFLKGTRGMNLDILARGPIWKLLMDYKCGTGHGVGYLLSVHEAPNGFRWKTVPERNDSAILVPGMITTNEPGIYLENKYGIRIENELLCVEKDSNEFGEFLGFETITYAPIDLDAIEKKLLTSDEKKWLNQYHEKVFETLEPYLTNEEKEWLKEYTKAI